jgi:hypothetical protein
MPPVPKIRQERGFGLLAKGARVDSKQPAIPPFGGTERGRIYIHNWIYTEGRGPSFTTPGSVAGCYGQVRTIFPKTVLCSMAR